jgi:hypothetical protein
MATLEDVRQICSKLPGALEGTDRFGFGVEVKGKVKGFVWTWMERVHPKKPKVENCDVLAIVTPGLGAKEVLMASEPEKYVLDPHYNGYPAVLVRLEAFEVDELSDLLEEAWRCKSSKSR